MLMEEAERRPVRKYIPVFTLLAFLNVFFRFKATKEMTRCVGFICDGDQAIRWRDQDRELAKHRSVGV
jgi:hypothetical protein